jgi:sugar phosphate isomerase/epimerase
MIKTLHGITTNYCNVLTEARIAKETGYEAMEFLHNKLLRYMDNGGTTEKLKAVLDSYGLGTGCINALIGIERRGEEKKVMLNEARRLCTIAEGLECPTIQFLALHGLDDEKDDVIMSVMEENISDIADIGAEHGIRFQLEVIAHTKFNSLTQGMDIIKRVNKKNVGMVIDFWHLWVTGLSTPEDIAQLDKDLIFGVHFCDGRKPYEGEAWDETVQRAYLPGEGDINVKEWADAVKATGFNGVWSTELFSPACWEYDLFDIAKISLDNLIKYTA